MNKFWILSALLIAFSSDFLSAQNTGVLGQWINRDDKDGQQKSVLEIYMKDGMLFGKIIELLPAATTRVCNSCPGDKAGKSLIQMDILWNMKPDGKEWSGGQIVDPKNGKVYSCIIGLDSPERLNVRGYIGFSLLGRTQIWERKH